MWTRQGIADRFDAVESAARQLAPVPPAGGGLLTVAAAKLAAALKVGRAGQGRAGQGGGRLAGSGALEVGRGRGRGRVADPPAVHV